jgi:hypothetical protein
MDFQKELDEIRKIRQAKYSGLNSNTDTNIIKDKQVYNYDERKDVLNWIKKCTKSDLIKERMDKNEKQDYVRKISKISIEDLDHFVAHELNINFMIDLYKFSP